MADSIKLTICWSMADNGYVCHAPPNFQRLYKLKFFQQKPIKFFSNKYFFSSHLILCYFSFYSSITCNSNDRALTWTGLFTDISPLNVTGNIIPHALFRTSSDQLSTVLITIHVVWFTCKNITIFKCLVHLKKLQHSHSLVHL